MTPCVVITRDRVSYTRLCVAALERCPELNIHIVDHGSSWPPMLDWLAGCPHPVHRRGDLPPRALWEWDGLAGIVGTVRPYLVTDPDVLLDCPPDWLRILHEVLDSGVAKVGLGLRIDDLPDTELAGKVRQWEGAFWRDELNGLAYRAPVDTTLALYQPLIAAKFVLGPAYRLKPPYLLRHLPWYGDLDSAEANYYRAHMLPGTSHWARGGW